LFVDGLYNPGKLALWLSVAGISGGHAGGLLTEHVSDRIQVPSSSMSVPQVCRNP
jgi:hypothetical protein